MAQFGLSGVVAATMMYAVLYEMPRQQQLHLEMSEKARAAGYDHGEKAVDKISASIDALGTRWSTVQGVTQNNQRELIVTQQRTNELLERTMGDDTPSASIASTKRPPIAEWSEPTGEWQPVRPKASKKASP